MLNDLQAPSVVDGKIVYWHRELPPLDAEPIGEHPADANSMRMVGSLAHRGDLSVSYTHLTLPTTSRV